MATEDQMTLLLNVVAGRSSDGTSTSTLVGRSARGDFGVRR